MDVKKFINDERIRRVRLLEDQKLSANREEYILEYYGEDPKKYLKEIQQITQLRKGLSSIPRDKNGCNAICKYYAQLHYLQSRFPMSTGGVASVPFIWHDIYSGEPVVYNDIRYEQACLLFNLGGLYSQLGANESRLADDSMKISCAHFQTAAGVYRYIKDNYVLSDMPDMTNEILSLKVIIMLGQSLECILEKSIRDDKNYSLISKISIQVKDYFNEAIDLLNHNGTSEMGSYLRKSWVKHLKIKVLCYEALAYSYMSNEAVKNEQFGQQVAYLKYSNDKITEASKLIKNQSDKVIEMVNFIMDVVGNKYMAAVKDNDFIYHMSVPEFAALPEIKPVNLVKPLLFTFDDPSIVGGDIFQKLIPFRAHEASSIYSEKKAEKLRDVLAAVQEKDSALSKYIASMDIADLMDPKEESLPAELITRNKFLQDNPDLVIKVEQDVEDLTVKTAKLDEQYADLTRKLQFDKEDIDENISLKLKELRNELDTSQDAHAKATTINKELLKIIADKKGIIKFLSGSVASILQSLPSQNVVEAPNDEPIVQRIREILGKVEKMKDQRMKLLSQLRDELNSDDITALLAVQEEGSKEEFFKEQLKKHDERIGFINQNLTAQNNIIQALTEANAKYATTREKAIAIKTQFQRYVQSYLMDIAMFLDVKERLRAGLEFYKALENDVSKLSSKINSFYTANPKLKSLKSAPLKGPPNRPTARKPDIIKNNATVPSNNTTNNRQVPPPNSTAPDVYAFMRTGQAPFNTPFPMNHPVQTLPLAPQTPHLPPGSLANNRSIPENSSLPNPVVTHYPSQQKKFTQFSNINTSMVPLHPNSPGIFNQNMMNVESRPNLLPTSPQNFPPFVGRNTDYLKNFVMPMNNNNAPLTPARIPLQDIPPPASNISYPYKEEPYNYMGNYGMQHQPQRHPLHNQEFQQQRHFQNNPRTPLNPGSGTDKLLFNTQQPTSRMHPQDPIQSRFPPQNTSLNNNFTINMLPAGPNRTLNQLSGMHEPQSPMVSSRFPQHSMNQQNVPSQQQKSHFSHPDNKSYPLQQQPSLDKDFRNNLTNSPHFVMNQIDAQKCVPNPNLTANQQFSNQSRSALDSNNRGMQQPGQMARYISNMKPDQEQNYHSNKVPPSSYSQPFTPNEMHLAKPLQQQFHGNVHNTPKDSFSFVDYRTDNSSLPPPLMPEKPFGREMNKNFQTTNQNIDPRLIDNFNDNKNKQMDVSHQDLQHNQQMPFGGSSNSPYYKQEPHDLVYPRRGSHEQLASSYQSPLNQMHTMNVFHSSNNNTNIEQPYQVSSLGNKGSILTPYLGPSMTPLSNVPNPLIATKPMMSPGLKETRDPVIANILSKDHVSNFDFNQLNMQQIHLQNMVMQQQQLIAMLQSLQSQQRSEEESKIQLLQQQICDQQKLINNMKNGKEMNTGTALLHAEKKPSDKAIIITKDDNIKVGKEVSLTRIENPKALPDVLGLVSEKSFVPPTVPPANINTSGKTETAVITSDKVPFYEPQLDTKSTEDDSTLILPRDQNEKVAGLDDDGDIIKPRFGEKESDSDNSSGEKLFSELNIAKDSGYMHGISTLFEGKSDTNNSVIASSSSQSVQLDDIDQRHRKVMGADDHRHLARQLGRLSFYVGGPEETVWLTYIQELDVAVSKLHIECRSLCKRAENMDGDGFFRIWNDLSKREELDVQNFSTVAGESNITKNRYRDILPWEHTRVKLLTSENNYINANFIKDLTPLSPCYIATQGPIPQTFADFWTMVWEQNSSIIVMLTNEIEGTKLKCHRYWSRDVDSRHEFDNLVVILIDEITTSGWKIRTFTLVDKKSEKTKMVKQFQFTSWPDYGTPESPYELLSFMEDIHSCHKELDSTFQTPIVLHCSAGVGRTGSFCCIYSAIREMQGQNGLIDIPGVIRKLRQFRPHMVQRKEQLIFCYQAILCFAQQFSATEMHKISTPRYQQRVQFPLDLLDENNENNRGMSNIEPSDSYVGEPTNQKASNS